MILDPVFLSRIQFAFTISFHIIFPAFTIGLASFLAMLEFLWLKTGKAKYKELYKFWVKIFAVTFGMGVVSGVVMSYQFGTNWGVLSHKIGNVIGPLLGYEVLTAFFLEASFLGIMLFGWGRVSKNMHFFSTCIVAIGTLISAFWILSANSWMHTPAGFIIKDDGILYPTNWVEVIFNSSFPYRYIHMISAAYLTTAFVVGGVAALYLLRNKDVAHAKTMLLMSVLMTSLVAPLQPVIGDFHGLNTLKHQPAKVSAMEGIWETEKGAGLRLFAIPNQQEQKNNFEVVIPYLTSLILTHSLDGEVKGLKEWEAEEIPPVVPVFFAFRVMVGIGLLMVFTALLSAIQYFRNSLFNSKWLLKLWALMIPSGFIALLSGWFVTEIGRQPYVVYGVLKTIEVASTGVGGPQVLWSLISFFVVYSFVFGFGIYYLFNLVKKGIKVGEEKDQFYSHGLEATILEHHSKR